MATILITGASSGIGRALALHYAAPGTHLVLTGRNAARLEETVAAARAKGATTTPAILDIRDREALARALIEIDAATPIDLVIANAAVTTGTPEGGGLEPAADSHELLEVNVLGVVNTLHPLLPRMVGRGRGQVAVVSSIAGLIPLPDSPSYCASKAALVAYGKAMRARLRADGIKVNVICPGFVATPMSARVLGWKPGEISPEHAAAIIASGLARNKAVIAFPRSLALLARIGALLPDPLLRLFLVLFRFETAAKS